MITLDENQRRVASHRDGPALVLAGAGAGKTASIIGRTLELVNSGVPASRILLLTFSRKAAREMRERARVAFGEGQAEIMASTFHSFCGRILRRNEESIRPPLAKTQVSVAYTGTEPLFPEPAIQEHQNGRLTQIDEGDQKDIARQAIRRQYLDPKTADEAVKMLPWEDWLSEYDRLRSEGYTALPGNSTQVTDAFAQAWWRVRFKEPAKDPMAAYVFQFAGWYETEKRLAHVIDYADLINLPLDFLRQNKPILIRLAHRYDQIIVDEAQDMDAVQYNGMQMIARAMSSPNLMLVGDDDQSIYGFRGSSPGVLRAFMDVFRPQVYRLERNYRSTKEIVDRASRHVAHNLHRIAKAPFSDREGDQSLFAYTHETDMDALYWITRRIQKMHAEGAPWNSFAVLYRTRLLGPQISALLTQYRIPYVIYGGIGFFEHLEIKFAGALARLAVNPRDITALRNLSPLLPGVGDRYQDVLRTHLAQNPQMGFMQAAELCATGRHRVAFQSMIRLNGTIRHLLRCKPETWGMACWECSDSGIQAYLRKQDEKEYKDDGMALQSAARRRLDNVSFFDLMLAGVIREADAEEAKHPLLLIAGLFVEEDREKEQDGDRVVLATVHACKGLEFDEVHIPGFVEPLMPRIIDDDIDLFTLKPQDRMRVEQQREEERRISYVAMTRAKHRLFLHVPKRFACGATLALNSRLTRSRYLAEMGLEPIQAPEIQAAYNAAQESRFPKANVIPFRPKSIEEDSRNG